VAVVFYNSGALSAGISKASRQLYSTKQALNRCRQCLGLIVCVVNDITISRSSKKDLKMTRKEDLKKMQEGAKRPEIS
jgi:hypothetical protein